MTMEWVFDIRDNDNFWCTADIGWITGHTYVVYGPLACGATTLILEAHDVLSGLWEMVEDDRKNTVWINSTLPLPL